MSETASNSEILSGYISELQGLRDIWTERTEMPSDVGECGGNMIAQIEQMGEVVIEMRAAFVTLLNQTISYMETRMNSIDEQDSTASGKIKENIAGGNAVVVSGRNGSTAEVKQKGKAEKMFRDFSEAAKEKRLDWK